MMERVDLKGQPDQREGKKASSGYFFSPWENLSLFGRSPEDCERKAISISVTARPWFHKSLLLRQKQTPIFTDGGLLFYNEGLEQSNATVRWTVAHRRSDVNDSLIFAKRKHILNSNRETVIRLPVNLFITLQRIVYFIDNLTTNPYLL